MKDSTTCLKRRVLGKLGALAFWLAAWQLASVLVNKQLLLVSPLQAGGRLALLAREGAFWRTVWGSCLRVLEGFGLALLVGGALAVVSARFRVVRVLFDPLLGVVRSTPVASFIILLLVWMSTGKVPVFVAFIMVVPLVWANLQAGLDHLDRELLEMARLFRFSQGRTLRCIVVPTLMPYFAAACSTGLGFAWKSVIAAEVIAQPGLSIGKQIYNAKVYLLTPDLFAWTIAVVALSILLEKGTSAGLRWLQRRMLRFSGEVR